MWQPWNNSSEKHVGSEIVQTNVERDLVLSDVQADNVQGDVQTKNVQVEVSLDNVFLHEQAQQIILNVYKKCVEVFGEFCAVKRTSEFTNVKSHRITVLVKRGVFNRKTKRNDSFSKFDGLMEGVVRRKIYKMYAENKVPTIQALMDELKEDKVDIPYSKMTVYRYVKFLNFSFKKLDQRKIILESPRIVNLRLIYLNKIQDFRSQQKTIVYLDETWYDTHDVLKRGWSDNTKDCCLDAPVARGKRIIILHAGCEKGFVKNSLLLSAKNISSASADYHSDMNSDLFETWFNRQLLPNIPPNSVIVMDNASYHSRQTKKIPTTASKKSDIIHFMNANSISLPDKITKNNMLEIIKLKNFEKSYIIDELASKNGHTILRLPPYYCIFNPIELVWSYLKRSVRKKNTCCRLSESVINLIKNEVASIPPDLWKNCVDHVKTVEKTFITQIPEPMIINLNDSSESEDSNAEYSSENE